MTTCATPLAFETLVALWTGELDDDAAADAEAHVFACDRCAAASDRLASLIDALRGALPPVISHAHRDRLLAAGTRISTTIVEPGVDGHARFAPDVDLLVHVLRADVARAARVDVELVGHDGRLMFELPHVPFDRARGEVLIACQRHYEEFHDPRFRVHVVEGGVRRHAGDYFVRHAWR